MKTLNLIVLIVVLFNIQVRAQSDSNIDDLLEDATAHTQNAAYLNFTDIYGSGSLFIGYQRNLIKDFWAEVGIGIGLRNIKTKKGQENITLEIGTPLRYLLSDSREGFPITTGSEDYYVIGPKTSFELGAYKNIIGEGISGVWSIGVFSRFASYDLEYTYEIPNSIFGSISGVNKVNRTSLYASLIYKMEFKPRLGIDYTAGVGPTFLSFGDSGKKNDLFNELKYTKADYFLSLKFYYLF